MIQLDMIQRQTANLFSAKTSVQATANVASLVARAILDGPVMIALCYRVRKCVELMEHATTARVRVILDLKARPVCGHQHGIHSRLSHPTQV